MKRPKPRNPVAKALRSPRFQKRVIRDATTYRRKGRPARRPLDDS